MGIVCVWIYYDSSVSCCVLCVWCFVFCVWFGVAFGLFLHSVAGFDVGYVLIDIPLIISSSSSSSHHNCLINVSSPVGVCYCQLLR